MSRRHNRRRRRAQWPSTFVWYSELTVTPRWGQRRSPKGSGSSKTTRVVKLFYLFVFCYLSNKVFFFQQGVFSFVLFSRQGKIERVFSQQNHVSLKMQLWKGWRLFFCKSSTEKKYLKIEINGLHIIYHIIYDIQHNTTKIPIHWSV